MDGMKITVGAIDAHRALHPAATVCAVPFGVSSVAIVPEHILGPHLKADVHPAVGHRHLWQPSAPVHTA
jgi:hypothetical protein